MAKKKTVAEAKIKRFKLSELRAARYNPRVISEEALAGLSKSLERFGCVEPLVVNIKGGKNTIVGGHQRLKVLAAQGVKTVNCVTVELTVKEEKALNVSLNNPAICGEFIEGIEEYLEQVRAGIGDAAFMDLRLEELRGEIAAEDNGSSYKEESLRPFKRTHILLSFCPDLLPKIHDHLEAIIKIEGVEYEQGSN